MEMKNLSDPTWNTLLWSLIFLSKSIEFAYSETRSTLNLTAAYLAQQT